MTIRNLLIDFDKDILEINGQKVKEPVEVELPGPGGWPLRKLFNHNTVCLASPYKSCVLSSPWPILKL